jgi:hypothetical protein
MTTFDRPPRSPPRPDDLGFAPFGAGTYRATMPTILVATSNGISVLDGTDPPAVALRGRSATSLARAAEHAWAILESRELWHHAGDQWQHVVDLERLRATCVASIDGELFVGSSEARLFSLVADELRPVEAFDRAPGRSSWYTPWGGPPDTRSIANWDEDVFVNVHVGGILHTDDGGATWSPTIDIDADVHQVTTSERLVLAACAGGLAVTADRGATWSMRTEGLDAPYSRAVTVCGDIVLVSGSRGPSGGDAGVYRGGLAAGPFERCRVGTGRFDGNIDSHCLDALPDGTLAAFGTADGRVYTSTDRGSTWEEHATGLPRVHRVLTMP